MLDVKITVYREQISQYSTGILQLVEGKIIIVFSTIKKLVFFKKSRLFCIEIHQPPPTTRLKTGI